MVRVRKSVAIARPLHEVFAFLADAANESTWRSEVDSMFHEGGPARGVGAKYRLVGSYQGRSGDAVLTCTEYTPNERVTYSGGEGPVSADFTYQTREDGGLTRVAMVVKVDVRGPAGAFAGMAERMLEKIVDEDLRRLKRILEKT